MIRVVCAVIFFEGRVLATQRGKHKNQPQLWEFPGGKIENGESPEECIVRELQEELRIHVKLKNRMQECFHDYGGFEINLIPFLAEFLSGTITLTEHMNYAWLKPEELLRLEWAPADIPVVHEILVYCGTGRH